MHFPERTATAVAPPLVFHDLSNEKAHGIVCVVCGADFFTTGIHAAPGGVSATTGMTVHACKTSCVAAAGEVAQQLALGGE